MGGKIEVKMDFTAQDIQRQLKRLEEREIPFAMALTATRTAKAAQGAIRDEINQVFDNPTPWIQNSTYVLAAKKSDPTAVVYAREWGGTPASTTLTPQIEGGQRQYKRSEGALRAGGYLPNGWQVAPGPGARRDKYENISRGQLQQVLSGLRVQRDRHQNRRQGKPTELFVVRPGTSHPLQPGVWQRVGRRPTLILTFIQRPDYSQRLDWHGVALRAGEAAFTDEIANAIDDILSGKFER